MVEQRNRVFKQIVNYFADDNWRFSQIKNLPKLLIEYKSGKGYEWQIVVEFIDDITSAKIIFYSIIPDSIPIRRDNVNYVGEFLHRINSSYIDIGNFEIDYDTGRVYCKTSIKLELDTLDLDTIDYLVYENLMLMNKYLGGIKAVAEGKLDPEEAQIKGRIDHPVWE